MKDERSNQSSVLNSQQQVTPSSRWSGWKNLTASIRPFLTKGRLAVFER